MLRMYLSLCLIKIFMLVILQLPCVSYRLHSFVLRNREISSQCTADRQRNHWSTSGNDESKALNPIGNSHIEQTNPIERIILHPLYDMDQCLSNNDYRGMARDLKAKASSSSKVDSTNIMEKVYNLLDSVHDQIDQDSLADIIWSLGKFADRDSNNRYRIQNFKLLRRLCSIKNLTSREVTTGFVGLAKMNLRWENLLPTDQEGILSTVGAVCTRANEREVGNLLHSLSRMGLHWTDLSGGVGDQLMSNLVRQHLRMKAEHGAMSIYALAVMGLTSDQMSPNALEAVTNMSTKLLRDIVGKIPQRSQCQQVK